jgi:2-polyprenyl-3-methyl-5-hydroxy-6-metoxy-1,4-benzoquinol methylase
VPPGTVTLPALELVWTAEPNHWLVPEVADLPPGRALDVGAGEGRNAIRLAERGWTVTTVDFSAVGLTKARHLADAQPPQMLPGPRRTLRLLFLKARCLGS